MDNLDSDQVNVCAGIIYPSAPKMMGLRERIEEYHNSFGLQVVWYDDARNAAANPSARNSLGIPTARADGEIYS